MLQTTTLLLVVPQTGILLAVLHTGMHPPTHGAAQWYAPSYSWCCTVACTLLAPAPCAASLSCGTVACTLRYLLVVLHTSADYLWCCTVAFTLGCLLVILSILKCEALQFQVWKGPHTEEEYAHIN